jgi:hypothetical protein
LQRVLSTLYAQVQVLTQVGAALQIDWPDTFRWLVDLLRVFSLDFLGALQLLLLLSLLSLLDLRGCTCSLLPLSSGFINIGCLTSYSYFEKVPARTIVSQSL